MSQCFMIIDALRCGVSEWPLKFSPFPGRRILSSVPQEEPPNRTAAKWKTWLWNRWQWGPTKWLTRYWVTQTIHTATQKASLSFCLFVCFYLSQYETFLKGFSTWNILYSIPKLCKLQTEAETECLDKLSIQMDSGEVDNVARVLRFLFLVFFTDQ